jgi:hypothetical protein
MTVYILSRIAPIALLCELYDLHSVLLFFGQVEQVPLISATDKSAVRHY